LTKWNKTNDHERRSRWQRCWNHFCSHWDVCSFMWIPWAAGHRFPSWINSLWMMLLIFWSCLGHTDLMLSHLWREWMSGYTMTWHCSRAPDGWSKNLQRWRWVHACMPCSLLLSGSDATQCSSAPVFSSCAMLYIVCYFHNTAKQIGLPSLELYLLSDQQVIFLPTYYMLKWMIYVFVAVYCSTSTFAEKAHSCSYVDYISYF